MTHPRLRLVRVSLVLSVSLGCEGTLLGADPLDTPANNFDILWQEFDRWYAGFDARRIDWNALYGVYRAQVTDQTTRSELWGVVTSMLDQLDDLHTEIDDPNNGLTFNAALTLKPPPPRDFDLDVIKTNYLTNGFRSAGGGRLLYGEVTSNVGYLYVLNFAGEAGEAAPAWTDDIDQVVAAFSGLDGVIVDVRHSRGGGDPTAHRLAGAFAGERRLVYTVQTRNGPDHGDFDTPTEWYVEPMGAGQFVGPVVILTDHITPSAAEVFTLLMTSLPHATHVGDSTGGGFSDSSFDRYLPNGWVYRMSHQLYKTPDGKSPEGIGIVPDVLISNTEADISAGRDRVLEFAISRLQS